MGIYSRWFEEFLSAYYSYYNLCLLILNQKALMLHVHIILFYSLLVTKSRIRLKDHRRTDKL